MDERVCEARIHVAKHSSTVLSNKCYLRIFSTITWIAYLFGILKVQKKSGQRKNHFNNSLIPI